MGSGDNFQLLTINFIKLVYPRACGIFIGGEGSKVDSGVTPFWGEGGYWGNTPAYIYIYNTPACIYIYIVRETETR